MPEAQSSLLTHEEVAEPPTQTPLTHVVPGAQVCVQSGVGTRAQAPSTQIVPPWQVSTMPDSGIQLPGTLLQAWHGPSHAVEQQVPSTQKPLSQSEFDTHSAPFENGGLQMSKPRPFGSAHTSSPGHWLSSRQGSPTGAAQMPPCPHQSSAPHKGSSAYWIVRHSPVNPAVTHDTHGPPQAELQHTPSTQWPLAHWESSAHPRLLRNRQVPVVLHMRGPSHMPGSVAIVICSHSPRALHRSQTPSQRLPQQTPSRHIRDAHWESELHETPFAAAHPPAMSQTSPAVHPSFVPTFVNSQRPEVPQVRQEPSQADSQHRPSAQKPLEHCTESEQMAPSSSNGAQAFPAQKCDSGQSSSPSQREPVTARHWPFISHH